MFGFNIPPSIDIVRIMAVTGKQGKRPCLWEGAPGTSQHEIESAIDSDLRVRRWLTKHHLIKGGTATLTLNLELYSQDKRVDTIEIKDVTLVIRNSKRKQTTTDEVVLKSMSVLDSTIKNLGDRLDKNWETLVQQLNDRETIIGRLVERGLNPPVPKKEVTPPPPQQDELSSLLEKGGQVMQFLSTFKALRENR